MIQRRLGFELELLTLVDIDGRPPPEKTVLGTYNNLELQVDHNGAVEGDTPTAPHAANFSVPAAGGAVPLGAYDLPANWSRQVGAAPGGAPVVDPRAGGPLGITFDMLRPARWQQLTALDRFNRPPTVNNTNLNNGQLPAIDQAIVRYNARSKDWEPDLADAELGTIINAVDAWAAANIVRPAEPSWYDVTGKRRLERYDQAMQTVVSLKVEALQHRAFWTNPANHEPPAGLVPLYRRPATVAHPAPAWSAAHPKAGGGGSKYASILELVTPAYEPETVPGANAIIGDVTAASTLAGAIEAGTANFANRIAFNTVAGVNVAQAGTHVGNAGPTRNPQSTDASIQSTFGIDLAQIPSLIKTAFGMATQNVFTLKHQSDEQGANYSIVRRAQTELMAAVTDATTVINHIKLLPAFALIPAPSFVNLRGLITLICQYLRMGKFWTGPDVESPLDKNLTDLLSRTNLSYIYRDTVPAAEKVWIQASGANLDLLVQQIFAATGRTQASLLLNQPAEDRAQVGGRPHYRITCDQFTRNVFTQATDGVTENLGGFQKRPVEDIDPAAARGGDTRRAGALHREGPVFELRNMVPKAYNAGERYPRAEWAPLAQYFAAMLQLLNSRTEAQAATDVRVRQNPAPAISADAAPW